MAEESEQLSMWADEPIVHVGLTLKGSKFEPDRQPAWLPGDVAPGRTVRFVVEGYVDDKLVRDRTEAGWADFVTVTVTRAYEVSADAAVALLEQGEAAVREKLRERLGTDLDAIVGAA